MEKWPNLFIVGAPKCGTTSLYEYLKKIPGIYMSPTKEPYFFCKTLIPENHYIEPIRDKEKYLKLFAGVKDEKIIGEGSIWYLSDPNSADLIHQKIPDARIIIILRDPIERSISHYLMLAQRNQFSTASFHEQLVKETKEIDNYSIPQIRLRAGLYFEDLKRFVNLFGKIQVKIIIFEEFIKEPKETMHEVLRFLKIGDKLENFKAEIHNPSVVPKNRLVNYLLNKSIVEKIKRHYIPDSIQWYLRKKLFNETKQKLELLKEDKKILKKYYNEDVKKLEEFLGRSLPWLNFTDI